MAENSSSQSIRWQAMSGGWLGRPADSPALLVVPTDCPWPTDYPAIPDAMARLTTWAAVPSEQQWAMTLDCHGKSVRVSCCIPGLYALRQRLHSLAMPDTVASTVGLDVTPVEGGFAIWRDGCVVAAVARHNEVAGELVGVLLQICLEPRPTLLLVHAAVVVVRGRPLILAARSGGGKTTLAMVLQSRGAILLSDDTAAIATDDGSLAALPLGVQVRKSSLELVRPHLSVAGRSAIAAFSGERRILAPHSFGKMAATAGPATVVLMEHQPAASGAVAGFSRLTTAEGLMGLIASGASMGRRADDDSVQKIGAWADRTDFFWMTFDTPEEGAHLVEDFAAS